MDGAAVVKATGRTLDDWFAILEERGAGSLTHKDIARLLRDDCGVPGWWSQMLTVEYERKIGRREVGQRTTGEFRTTVSRTLSGTMDEALDRWLAALPPAGAGAAFDGAAFASEPTIRGTEKRRSWRVTLTDGARITAVISAKPQVAAKGGEATLLAVETSRLTGRSGIDRWKAFWKGYLPGI